MKTTIGTRIPGRTKISDPKLRKGSDILLRNIRNRIFFQGKDIDNKLISTRYSRKPLYISKDKLIKKSVFKLRGKNGDRTKATMYVPGGYKQLRSLQGLEVRKVNLEYTGELNKSLRVVVNKGVVRIGFKDRKNALKAEGLEKKYRLKGKIFRPSKREIRDLINYVQSID